jgi:hypothetical protein
MLIIPVQDPSLLADLSPEDLEALRVSFSLTFLVVEKTIDNVVFKYDSKRTGMNLRSIRLYILCNPIYYGRIIDRFMEPLTRFNIFVLLYFCFCF